MVGDSETDIIAGQNASVKTVLVSYGYCHIPHKQLGADIIIDRCADLPMALDQLANTRGVTTSIWFGQFTKQRQMI